MMTAAGLASGHFPCYHFKVFLKTGDKELDAIPTHILWSITSLVFCFFPALIAIYYSFRVIDDKKKGDAFNAIEHARSAKIFVIISFALGLIVIIIPYLMK